jgi:hypothetical protein
MELNPSWADGGPEIGTSSIDWAQLSRLLPEDGVQYPKRCVLSKKTGRWIMSVKSIIVLRRIVAQMLKTFSAFYGIRRSMTMFRRARHWSLSWAKWIQSISYHHIKHHYPYTHKISGRNISLYVFVGSITIQSSSISNLVRDWRIGVRLLKKKIFLVSLTQLPMLRVQGVICQGEKATGERSDHFLLSRGEINPLKTEFLPNNI